MSEHEVFSLEDECQFDLCRCGKRNFEHTNRELVDCILRDLDAIGRRCDTPQIDPRPVP